MKQIASTDRVWMSKTTAWILVCVKLAWLLFKRGFALLLENQVLYVTVNYPVNNLILPISARKPETAKSSPKIHKPLQQEDAVTLEIRAEIRCVAG